MIVGPTASGKTELSCSLASEIFEIVSADSVQVYRLLDIGSGKPDAAIRGRIRHHLIDIVEPDYPFSAGDFCRLAENACREITGRGKIPMFVGGTGLYIDSFFLGLSEIPDIEPSIREKLSGEMDERGPLSLYDELKSVDPVFAGRISANDRQRILRGLEVQRGTGRPLSSFFEGKRGFQSERTLFIGLSDERMIVRERIARRVDSMIKQGLVEEVRSLREMGFGPELKSMKSIGYWEINMFLDGALAMDETVEKIKINTGRYAKRQMTWFRRRHDINWFRPGENEKIIDLIKEWIDN